MSHGSHAPGMDGGALKLGRFELQRRLGEGSMGAVYLAFDRVRGDRVALKTLRRVDGSGIYRFKREFRGLADVSHPNLVALHELFSEGSDWFFTMEYVEGQDFRSYLGTEVAPHAPDGPGRHTRQLRAAPARRAPGMEVLFPTPLRNPDRAREVLRQVTAAVMALHGAGKLHRDLKPDNVMVTGEGRAVVLDFGIGAELHPDAHGTLEPGVMGTPAYMSPEQAKGGEVTEATDWYALGVMLYEALTGQVPFDGPYMEVLEQKQRLDPPRPSQLVSGVPNDLDAICVRLLARDPALRPSGREILQALGSSGPTGAAAPANDSHPPFIGRAHELAELERALAGTESGAPVVVFVQGMTGMGKTALVETFLDGVAKRGVIALSGRCYEHEAVPFKALDSVVDALSRYLGRLSDTEAAEVLPKEIHALSQLFPVLRRVDVARTARRRGAVAADPRMLRQQAARGLKEMLARIAMRQPLVLFIDDLQWGDVDSALLLAELLSGPERPAVLLLCTYRSADRERSPCLSTLLELLRGSSQVQLREVAVEELSEQESVELSRTLLGAEKEQDAVAIARESRGSPYLLGELVDHVRGERDPNAPETRPGEGVTLERALSERLETLSAEATTVLELVAVSGRPLREEVIAQLAAGELNLANALIELRRTKLVRGVGSPDSRAVGIYHDSIREAVLARMHPSWVADLHKRLAAAIEKSEPVDLAALTEHLIGAGDHARAGIYAISAAREAADALAFDKAAALYQIALEHHEDEAWRQELYAQLAEALVSAGRSSRAAEVYLQAVKTAQAPEASDLRLKAGVQLLQSGRWERGMEVLAPALAKLEIELPRGVTEAIVLAAQHFQTLRERGFDFAPKAEQELPARTRTRLDALWSLVQATFSADPVLCQGVVLRHLLEALDAGEKSRIVVGLCAHFIIVDLVYSTARGSKPRALQQAQALARDTQDPRIEAWVSFARAFSFQNEGLLKPASLDFARAEDLFRNRCRNVMPELNACRMLYARTLVMLGQIDDHGQTERWIREASQCEDPVAVARLRLIAVPRRLLLGDLPQAERALEMPAELHDNPLGLTRVLAFSARAWLAHHRDDHSALRAQADESESMARSPLFIVPVWQADHQVLRARTLLALSRHLSDPEPMLMRAEAAIAQLERLALECYVDHAHMLRATLFHRRGRDQEAASALDAIFAEADMGGESSLVRLCARMCKGWLLGGDEGATLVRDAERDLERRGVSDPKGAARLYASGFAEPSDGPAAT